RDAAATSMLSTPMPARPMILSRLPASMTGAVTLVRERTSRPSNSPIAAVRSPAASPNLTSTWTAGDEARISAARSDISSEMRTRNCLGIDDLGWGSAANHEDDVVERRVEVLHHLDPVLILRRGDER